MIGSPVEGQNFSQLSISRRLYPIATTTRSLGNSARQQRASLGELSGLTGGLMPSLFSGDCCAVTHSRSRGSQARSLGRLKTTPISAVIRSTLGSLDVSIVRGSYPSATDASVT